MKHRLLMSLVCARLATFSLTACAGGGDTGWASNLNLTFTSSPNTSVAQFTPNQANWDTFTSKPLASGNMAHDPDSVSWISPESWVAAQWDGTVYNPTQMSSAEFANAICPTVDQVRGIREVFYAHKPFADNANPTKAEVDEWHRIAINHVRSLVGYTSSDRQVQKDQCMYARALWGDERKFTTRWDSKYPGTVGSAEGPCQGSSNAHCGASFIPDLIDQAPYLPAGHPGCGVQQGAEGVFSGPKSNIPWSIKWSRSFCNTLLAEGFWGGHMGPWFQREKFGFSFWDNDPGNNNSNAILRAKWTGNLMPSGFSRAPMCTLSAAPSKVRKNGKSILTPSCNPAATTYVWTGGTCLGSTASTCTVTPSATTAYGVTGTNAYGSSSASATVTVRGADLTPILMLLLD